MTTRAVTVEIYAENREMTDAEICELARAAKVCVCAALIEEIDSGSSWSYWAHVKRGRIEYDHSAVPARPTEQS